jgi:hypothetical protein
VTDRAARLALGVSVLACLLSACAGPTVSAQAMRSQAGRSALSVVSELQTVDLAVRTQLRGDAWWSYTDVTVTSAEHGVSTIEGTLTSRQPPPGTDPVYRRTSDALAAATDLVTEVRIAVRRQDTSELTRLRKEIPPLVKELESIGRLAP